MPNFGYLSGMAEHSFNLCPVKGYIATIFLVVYDDRILMLDGGARFDAVRIENYLADTLERPVSQLQLALVTHMHPDHAGGAPVLRRRHGTRIASHQDIDRWYRGIGGAAQHLIDTLLGHYSARQQFGHFERAWYPRYLRPDVALRDGDSLPAFSDWQALAAPGHTLYDLVFWHQATGTLYAGDLLVKVGRHIVLPFPTLFPALMRTTLARMARLPVKRLLLAHGGELEIADSEKFFSSFIDRVGQVDRLGFRLIRPFCSLAPDCGRAD